MPDIRGDGSILPYTAQWQDLEGSSKGILALDSGIQAIHRRGGNDTEWGKWANGACGPLYFSDEIPGS